MYIYDIPLFQVALWHIFSIWCISAAKAERDCIKGKKGTQTVWNNRPELVQALVCQASWEIPLVLNRSLDSKVFAIQSQSNFHRSTFFPPETQHSLNCLSRYLACFPTFCCHTRMKKNPLFIYSRIKNALKLLAFKVGKFASGEPWSSLSCETGYNVKLFFLYFSLFFCYKESQTFHSTIKNKCQN